MMSVSNFAGKRPDSALSVSGKRVDTAEGSFVSSASANMLNDSQDGSSDEEDHNDKAFA